MRIAAQGDLGDRGTGGHAASTTDLGSALNDESFAAPHDLADDEILDEQADEILDLAVDVGRERLDRTPFDILITAVIGGVEVSLGAIAAAAVLGATLTAAPSIGLFGALTIAGVVFPIGFLFVILGRSELFTENFLIPVVAVLDGTRKSRDLVELWLLSWIGNVIGCALMATLISLPEAVGSTVTHGLTAYTDYKLGVSPIGTLASALLAGITMTILTWLIVGVRAMVGKVAAILAAGYVLFAVNLAHTIVGAALIFAGYRGSGHSLYDVVRWLSLATVGNIGGGVAFVTGFRVVQVKEKQVGARQRPPDER